MKSISDGVYLNTKNTKDDEEGTADKDDVANGLEGCDEGLDYELQPWSPADHPGGPRGRYRERKTERMKHEET